MSLPKFSINRPVTVIMVILVAVTIGLLSLFELPTDMFPEITFPVISIVTRYSGAAPEEVEKLITQPLEEALSTITGVTDITSTSQHALSMVNLKFDWGTNLDAAAADVRDSIQFAKRFLPDDAGQPVVVKIDLSKMPIWVGTLKGKRSLPALNRLADKIIKPRLSRIDGVAALGIISGEKDEVLIEPDLKSLENAGVGFNTLLALLSVENRNIPGGDLKSGSRALTIRTMGETDKVEELGKIPLGSNPDGSILLLSRIARILRTVKKEDVFISRDGEICLAVQLMKQSGRNSVKVLRDANAEMDRIRAELPEDVKLETVFDQSEFINQSVSSVTSNLALGGILSILVLSLFLDQFTLIFIIFLAIPISVVLTFIPMYFMKYSLNIMSLGGLALGVGMLVDNAIVVLENIDRHLGMGKSPASAAEDGTNEVAGAITGSTLTTLAVFIPFLFSSGVASKLFTQLGLAIAASLTASLLMAQTLVPMMAAHLVKKARPRKEGTAIAKYRILNEFCLNHPKKTVILFFFVFLFSVMVGVPNLGVEYIPIADDGFVGSPFRLPVGTSIDESKKVIAPALEKIGKMPEVFSVFERIGFPEGAEEAGAFIGLADSNEGELFIRLKPKRNRAISTREFIEKVRPEVNRIPGLKINLRQSFEQLFNTEKASIEIRVLGQDISILKTIMGKIKERISTVEGVRDIDMDLTGGKPELQLSINRDLAIQAGLSGKAIGEAVRTAVQGRKTGLFRQGGEEMDIRLRGPSFLRNDLTSLLNIPIEVSRQIPGENRQKMTTLRQLGSLKEAYGEEKIFRQKQMRCGSVYANYAQKSLGEVMRGVLKELDGIKLPEGYFIDIGGTYKDLVSAIKQLISVFFFGALLVYMIMASQFESFKDPFVIMFSVPLAVIGMIGGLLICRETLNVSSALGLIILLGIVVNNAIVLLDYVKQLRIRGFSLREALLEGPSARSRPIAMTTITTVLGLIPLALGWGEGTEVQQPLAISIIFGLSFSTLLTLFVILCVYLILEEKCIDDKKN